jgi:hypothetical protein
MKKINREHVWLIGHIIISLYLLNYLQGDHKTSIVVAIITTTFLLVHITMDDEIQSMVRSKYSYWTTVALVTALLVIGGQQVYIHYDGQELGFLNVYAYVTSLLQCVIAMALVVQFGMKYIAVILYRYMHTKTRVMKGLCEYCESYSGLRRYAAAKTIRPNYDAVPSLQQRITLWEIRPFPEYGIRRIDRAQKLKKHRYIYYVYYRIKMFFSEISFNH